MVRDVIRRRCGWAVLAFVSVVVSGRAPAARATLAAADTPQTRAAALLARGRAAIGPIDSLRSLSATGTRKSMLGSSAGAPEAYELHFVLPDRFVQFVKTLSPSNDIRTYVWGFNGSTSLNGLRTSEPMLYNGRETDATLEQRLFARLLLGWLLITPPYLPVEYSYVGEAEAADARKAFVIEVKGDRDFLVRLFLDQASCRPLMLAYTAAGVSGRAALDGRSAQRGRGAVLAPTTNTDALLYFSDVRPAGPLQIAHAVIDSRGGRTAQELTFSKLIINPELKPALFTQP